MEQNVYGFLEAYFPELDDSPFENWKEQWEAWQRFTDMLCMISLVMKEKSRPESLMRVGCLLRDEELVATLEPREKADFPRRKDVARIFSCLIQKGSLTEEGEALPLWQFFNTGMLEPVEIGAFLFAACADQNRKYERIFGILTEDEGTLGKPTIGLVHDLCRLFLSDEENQTGILLDEDSFLNRFLLEPVKGEKIRSKMSRPLSLKKQVLSLLFAVNSSMGDLALCGKLLETETPEELIGHEEAFEKLVKLYMGIIALEETAVIRLEGVRGVGKKFLMQCLGYVSDRDVLCIQVKKLLALGREKMEECLQAAVLKAVCENTLVYLEQDEYPMELHGMLQWVLAFLQAHLKVLFIGVEKQWPEELAVEGGNYLVTVKIPTLTEQKRFWEILSREHLVTFSQDVDLDQVVSRYFMVPKTIKNTLEAVSMTARAGEDGFSVSREDLEREIRSQCSTALAEYAKRIESPFVWEDLQLSYQSSQMLRKACDRVRFRSVVNDGFGFGRKVPYGNGVSIVLYGPPGTGKTMAAQVFAKEMGMDIYRIDLSQIGSKYIGETEKNLARVFDAARFSNAVLFFDEADALFAKRTEVSSSNDKYANAETAYLLQKIEEYSGVSILATNIMQNFDNAFKRRMTFMIPVEQPDEGVRLKLWQKAFPPEAPLERDVDFSVYARVAELTGSNIKSAALSAAYCAAAEHRSISNQDLIEAVDFEYRRTGRMGIGNELYGALYIAR